MQSAANCRSGLAASCLQEERLCVGGQTCLYLLQLLLEHHKEHWVTVRRHFKADRDRNMERYEHRLAALVPSLPPDDDAATAALAPMEL